MQINGVEQQRGHVLLIAGDAAVRRRTVQIEPSANLAALSIVPVPVLLGSDIPSDTTYLDGVRDQNALLTRLRAAAATPGPLLVYLAGRLTVDRRGHQLYLALAGTTASTARYTALPWEWLGAELRQRPPGLTTVLLDAAADKRAWPLLQEYGSLPAPGSVEVYGTVAPPGFTGSDSTISAYTRVWIEQLRRTPQRPTNSRLHALTVGAAALPPGTLIVPTAPELAAPEAATQHAAQQTAARPPQTAVQRILAGDTEFIEELRERRAPDPAPAPAPQPPQAPARPTALAPAVPATASLRFPPPQAPAAQPAPAPQQRQHAAPEPQPVRAAHPDPQQPAVVPHIPAQTRAQAPVQQAPALVPPPVVQQSAPTQDPRPYVYALAQQRKFNEAAHLAQAWETHALQTYGIDSPQATQWVEIRADLAKQQGNFVLATQLWISAGRTRLAHQSPDAPEVLATAKSAHYCWTQIRDPRQARECGPELISLLRALPSLDRRHLSVAQQRLEFLHNAPSGS
ncbi:hypothetical protein SHJG_p218 (plasmid) [Streptomyces hygroscopicus subsp. jinggangensis 5008]|nr:hypothetical protein SHJG_p218 [Streptomyces hygroscopicus subsp. jinggangensis 5008]AGF68487.1 hypothetical protein SHJGH_p218 [Streptomyces hygroscopicus subsp. jinggangensis TL01]